MKNDLIVIGSEECEKHLFVIGKFAMTSNSIELQFVSKYSPTVEFLLRLLRKGFGWFEVDRGVKDVENTKCFHNNLNRCSNKEANFEMHCSELVRASCKHYKKKFNNKFTVNYVVIEKAGGIRGIE